MTMMGMRRAARARMQRVIKRAEARQVIPAPAPAPARPPAQARVDRWVQAQVVNYPFDRCLGCKRPFAFGAVARARQRRRSRSFSRRLLAGVAMRERNARASRFGICPKETTP